MGRTMKLKEYFQFLMMMIPTLLLLVAAVVTLVLPMGTADDAPVIVQAQTAGWE